MFDARHKSPQCYGHSLQQFDPHKHADEGRSIPDDLGARHHVMHHSAQHPAHNDGAHQPATDVCRLSLSSIRVLLCSPALCIIPLHRRVHQRMSRSTIAAPLSMGENKDDATAGHGTLSNNCVQK